MINQSQEFKRVRLQQEKEIRQLQAAKLSEQHLRSKPTEPLGLRTLGIVPLDGFEIQSADVSVPGSDFRGLDGYGGFRPPSQNRKTKKKLKWQRFGTRKQR